MSESLFNKNRVQSIAKLKNLLAINVELIETDMNNLLSVNQTLVQQNATLLEEHKETLYKYEKLLKDYNATLDAIEQSKVGEAAATAMVTTSSAVEFDPAIHNYKPSRPITKVIRDQILDAYKTIYKVDEDCKTLPDFFTYVNAHICPTASKTEIEGVIYNRFDERLYH